MPGMRGRGELALVAGEAVRGRALEALRMAGGAVHRTVRPAQLEVGLVVAEGGRLPGPGAVAALASGGETAVVRLAGLLERRLVTGEAVRAGGGENQGLVAGLAARSGVGPGKLEAGLRVLVRQRVGQGLPRRERVALRAGELEFAVRALRPLLRRCRTGSQEAGHEGDPQQQPGAASSLETVLLHSEPAAHTLNRAAHETDSSHPT